MDLQEVLNVSPRILLPGKDNTHVMDRFHSDPDFRDLFYKLQEDIELYKKNKLSSVELESFYHNLLYLYEYIHNEEYPQKNEIEEDLENGKY